MAKTSKRLSAKRVIALITAFLFVLSGMPLSSISAQAAVKKPTIAKSATLKVGTSKTIKISKGSYKIVSVKVSSSKKSVATVKASGKVAIKVTGKKAGKATITTRVKAKKGKTSKTFKLTTKVTVKKATKPEPTVDTSKTVNTQDELVAALADSSITQITIGQEATSITIPAGDYSKVDLIVDAPNASITNKGVFKSITIKAIAANTWHEDANGNKIYTDNEKGIRIVLEKGASVESVKIGETTTGEVKIEVAGGSVASIEIAGNEKVDIALSDDATVGTVKVDAAAKVDVTATGTSKIEKVEVTEKAAGTATDKTVVNIKAEGSASVKEVTTAAANSTTNVTANGSAEVAKVAVSGNAAASISGTSNKVTEVDIKNADQNASVTVNTTSVKIETKAGTDNEKIINNQSGQALKTEEVQADGTKKETTTATDTTPSSGGGSSTPQQYSIIAPGAITGGSVTASKDKAAAGESVALVIAPADGYVLDGISVSYGSSHAEVQLIPADNGYTFTVPEGDVTVSAAFRALIPVTVADIRTTTGTSIEVTRGQYGEESYISLVTTQVNGIKFTYVKTEDEKDIFAIDENGKVTFWLEAGVGTYEGKFTVTAIGDGAYYTGIAEKEITVTVTVEPNAFDRLQAALNDKNATTVEMKEDVTVPEGETLTVPTNVTLTTGECKLTVEGTLDSTLYGDQNVIIGEKGSLVFANDSVWTDTAHNLSLYGDEDAYYTIGQDATVTLKKKGTVEPTVTIAGGEVTLNKNANTGEGEYYQIASDATLEIASGATLNVGASTTIENEGTISGEGTLALASGSTFNGKDPEGTVTTTGIIKTDSVKVFKTAITTSAVTEIDLTANITIPTMGTKISDDPTSGDTTAPVIERCKGIIIGLGGNTLDLKGNVLKFNRGCIEADRAYTITGAQGSKITSAGRYYTVLVQGNVNNDTHAVSLTVDKGVTIEHTPKDGAVAGNSTVLAVYTGIGKAETINLSGVAGILDNKDEGGTDFWIDIENGLGKTPKFSEGAVTFGDSASTINIPASVKGTVMKYNSDENTIGQKTITAWVTGESANSGTLTSGNDAIILFVSEDTSSPASPSSPEPSSSGTGTGN